MSGPAKIVRAPDAEEVRAYILSMLMELADMADTVQERGLAEQMRDVAWPAERGTCFRAAGR
jgi:hypothetical protein